MTTKLFKDVLIGEIINLRLEDVRICGKSIGYVPLELSKCRVLTNPIELPFDNKYQIKGLFDDGEWIVTEYGEVEVEVVNDISINFLNR